MQRAGGSTGSQKAAELLFEAERSVGNRTALHEAKQDFKRLIDEYERIDEILSEKNKVLD